MSSKWYFLMAWRDARRSKSRLLLFVSSITLELLLWWLSIHLVKTLRMISMHNLKNYLGADLELASNDPNFHYDLMDSLEWEVSYENSFASMIFFPKNQQSRLVDVRSLRRGFPYYGTIETEPLTAESTFRSGGKKALVINQCLYSTIFKWVTRLKSV